MEKTKTNPLLAKIENKTAKIGVIGMGYIGLQILDVFGRQGFPILGFDVDEHKISCFRRGDSTLNFLPLKGLFSLLGKSFEISSKPDILSQADCIIVSVPTDIDRHLVPNFDHLRAAYKTIEQNLQEGQLIIVQSTTYPGSTEEELLPLLEKSGKKFYLGNVPEISDPGNEEYNFSAIPRMISGYNKESLKLVNALYQSIGCQVYVCKSIRVAEAAKVYTNAYRLINISFANEMKLLFDKMGMDIWEVIEAAASKPFGFMSFYPSPGIGGDCIPVDPSFLSWKGEEYGAETTLINQSLHINQKMPHYIVQKLHEKLPVAVCKAKILILGLAYKKDVNSLSESASLKLLELLPHADFHDPYIQKFGDKQAVSLNKLKDYDAVIIATDHSSYDFARIVKESRLVIDTRNATKGLPQDKVVKA